MVKIIGAIGLNVQFTDLEKGADGGCKIILYNKVVGTIDPTHTIRFAYRTEDIMYYNIVEIRNN